MLDDASLASMAYRDETLSHDTHLTVRTQAAITKHLKHRNLVTLYEVIDDPRTIPYTWSWSTASGVPCSKLGKTSPTNRSRRRPIDERRGTYYGVWSTTLSKRGPPRP